MCVVGGLWWWLCATCIRLGLVKLRFSEGFDKKNLICDFGNYILKLIFGHISHLVGFFLGCVFSYFICFFNELSVAV